MTIRVAVASRYLNRKSGKTAKSVFKSLTEAITNSDDSYRRLIQKGLLQENNIYPIQILYEKKTKCFKIIDQAEGLTNSDMEEKFSEYGKDTSGSSEGLGVRGLFGQGISDVLFFHKNGVIRSIVDKTLYVCKFIKNNKGEWLIDPKQTNTRVDKVLRQSLGITPGNGTVVSFELSEKSRKPHKFVEELENYYMLRFILSDPHRQVSYIEANGNKPPNERMLHYDWPDGEVLVQRDEELTFQKFSPVTVKIEIRRAPEPLANQQNGLLVFDDKKAVYALSMFGFQNSPGIERIFGTVQLTGIRSIITEMMNQKDPEEILNDDRSGFNTEHEFYCSLETLLKPIIEPFIRNEPKVVDEQDHLSPEQRENQKKALKALDDLYEQLVDVTLITKPQSTQKAPEAGLEFDRSQIKTTVNKYYGLGLNINTDLVPLNSTIELRSSNSNVIVQPELFTVEKEMMTQITALARKHITIKGLKVGETAIIDATAGNIKSTVQIEVLEEEQLTTDSMAFASDEISARMNHSSKAVLVINTDKIPIGSLVKLYSNSKELNLTLDQIPLIAEQIDHDEIAIVKVPFATGGISNGTITAVWQQYQASVLVHVVDSTVDTPKAPTAVFKDWQFDSLGNFQCSYMPDTGLLKVNRDHPLNRIYFSENPTKESVSNSPLASVYLAELLLGVALDFMITKKWRKDLDSGFDPLAKNDPHGYITSYLRAKKLEIGTLFHSIFVDQKLIQRYRVLESTLRESNKS